MKAAISQTTTNGISAPAMGSETKEYGADVVTKARSFGPTRPAVIGGSTAARDDNRRVVLLVTG